MNRKPNTQCAICQNPIYRAPHLILKSKGGVFCNKICYGISLEKPHPCVICGKKILARMNRKTCSKECENLNRIQRNQNRSVLQYKGDKPRNNTEYRLAILMKEFNFTCCMIDECQYNKTYDVHRYIPGKDGGEYIIGNMFAICPMHHAEVTRNLIQLKKINDCTLTIGG